MSIIDPKLLEVQRRVEQGESVLKAIRETLGMSREQMAVELSIAATTVYRWETGRAVPSLTIPQVKSLNKILKRINMTVDDLPDDLGSKSNA